MDKVNSKKMNFLTSQELLNFSKIDVSEDLGLKLTKDRFLFSCYTGLCHIDVNNLIQTGNYQEQIIKASEMENTLLNILLDVVSISFNKSSEIKNLTFLSGTLVLVVLTIPRT